MNNFLINFETNVMLSGMVQIQAGNKTEAKIIAKKLIEKNLNLEDCLIELGTENNMNENITIREMEINGKTNITDIMPLQDNMSEWYKTSTITWCLDYSEWLMFVQSGS